MTFSGRQVNGGLAHTALQILQSFQLQVATSSGEGRRNCSEAAEIRFACSRRASVMKMTLLISMAVPIMQLKRKEPRSKRGKHPLNGSGNLFESIIKQRSGKQRTCLEFRENKLSATQNSKSTR